MTSIEDVKIQSGRKDLLYCLWFLFFTILVGFSAFFLCLKDSNERSLNRITLYEKAFKLQVQKYNYVPSMVSMLPEAMKLVVGDYSSKQVVNSLLSNLNKKVGVAAIYIVGSDGIVISSSNFDQEHSYVGLDLNQRPYFKNAMKGHEGSFYGVGLAAEKAGYYLSSPIYVDSEVKGVAVVKVRFSSLQGIWAKDGENIMVVDRNGVIILSSCENWRYRTLKKLTPVIQANIKSSEQFTDNVTVLRNDYFELGTFHFLKLQEGYFIATEKYFPYFKWKGLYLVKIGEILIRVLFVLVCFWLLLFFILILKMKLNQRKVQKLNNKRLLEAMKIQEINSRLQVEIEKHKVTEQELRNTQEELIEAGKLAALGELATAVAHELNQPISALKMDIASCRLLAGKQNYAEVDKVLERISGISDRMKRVTDQLKSFARRSDGHEFEFEFRDALKSVLRLMNHRFQLSEAKVVPKLSDEPLLIKGDISRFEQVLINLFANALDAQKESRRLQIDVQAVDQGNNIEIVFEDNGKGFDCGVIDTIFDPFVTTKDNGVGLGLGLSISNKIIKDMGGIISAENRKSGGARFMMVIPKSYGE